MSTLFLLQLMQEDVTAFALETCYQTAVLELLKKFLAACYVLF